MNIQPTLIKALLELWLIQQITVLLYACRCYSMLESHLAACERRSHVSVRDKKMCPRPNFCNTFLQAGLTDLDEIWHDGDFRG